MTHFPIIKIPQKLIEAKNAFIPIPPTPPAPIKPKVKHPTRAIIVSLSVVAFFIVIIAIVNHNSDDFLSLMSGFNLDGVKYSIGVYKFQIIFAGVPLLAYLIYYLSTQNSKAIYKRKLSNYFNNYESYKIELATYLENVERLYRKENLNSYRKTQTDYYLKSTTLPDMKARSVNKGRFEDYFHSKLHEYFGTKVSNNLQLGYFENPFVPDFVYADHENKLFIDIEIDEPYVYETGEPIHYIGKDDYRDSFFLDNQWIVVRFSEDQIASNADDCCRQIENVILHILNNDNLKITVSQVKRWTKEEAILMLKNNHRLSKNI